MKRHTQQPGIRQWAAEDILELQSEPLKALDGFFEEYGPCVIKGCHLTDNGNETYNLSAGLVALSGIDANGKETFKIVPFLEMENVPLPLYLTLTYSVIERPYMDGQVKPIAYQYKAAVAAIKPKSAPYLMLDKGNFIRFVDVLQSGDHLFLTEAERKKLAGIEKEANKYVHPAKHSADMIAENETHRFFTDTERRKLEGLNAENYAPKSHGHTVSEVSDLPTSLPANGGNADTVGGKAPSFFAPANHTHDNICPCAVSGIYMTKSSENPAVRWPGTTWVKIEGRFLYGTSGSEGSGGTGGAPSVALGVDNIPSHNHSLSVGTHDAGNHNHSGGNHQHRVDNHSHTQPSHTHSVMINAGYGSAWPGRLVASNGGTGGNGSFSQHGNWGTTEGGGGAITGQATPYTDFQDPTTSTNGNHSHSMWGSVGYEGLGSAFSIIPPYVKVHMWERQS